MLLSSSGRGVLATGLLVHLLAIVSSALPAPTSLGPPGGNIKSLAYCGDGALVAGTYHGRMFLSVNYGEVWRDITPSFIDPEHIIEQLDANQVEGFLYAVVRNLKHGFVVKTALGTLRSDDRKWETLITGIPIRSFAMASTSPATYYIGTDDRLVYSVDGGSHWDITTFAFPDPQIESIAIDPDDARTIYAGSWQRAFKSTDAGKRWAPIHTGMAADSDIFTMLFDQDKKLYAGTCGYIYVSTNKGLTWAKTHKGLKGKRIHALALSSANAVIAGSDKGLYLLDRLQGTWRELIPGITIHDIAVDEHDEIYCATEGEGVLKYRKGKPGYLPLNQGLTASSPKKIIIRDSTALMVGVINQNSVSGLWVYEAGEWRRLDLAATITDINDFLILDEHYLVSTAQTVELINATVPNRSVRLIDKSTPTTLFYQTSQNRLLVGTLTGLVYVNLGDAKTTVAPEFVGLGINAIWAGSTDPDRLFIGTNKGLYFYSTKFQTWLKAELNLGDAVVYEIEGRPDGGEVFVATDQGLVVTHDKGLTFNLQTRGLPETACLQVAVTATQVYALFSDGSLYGKPAQEFQWRTFTHYNLPVWSLSVASDNTKAYIGTNGYGVVAVDLAMH